MTYSHNPLHDSTDYHNQPDLGPEQEVCIHCNERSNIEDMLHSDIDGWVCIPCLPALVEYVKGSVTTDELEEFKNGFKQI